MGDDLSSRQDLLINPPQVKRQGPARRDGAINPRLLIGLLGELSPKTFGVAG